MSSEQTEKSRYRSKYSPDLNFITAAQYISELICEKKAQSEGRGLSIKFWELPEWEKYYKSQIPSAHQLLKKYHEKDIIAALRDYRAQKIYSLRNKYLKKIIEEKSKQRKDVEVQHTEFIEKKDTLPPKPFGNQTLLNKLRDNNE